MDKWTPVSGTYYTLRDNLEICKKELFDYTPNVTEAKTTLPTKVQQYSHYSLGSSGYGAPKGTARVDAQGNIVYGFDK